MELPVYRIDAFSDRPFAGNPAAVVPLQTWLPEATMQSIAAEMNLSETAFFVPEGDRHRIRWFTPTVEVPLCGHATLASAHVLMSERGAAVDRVAFDSASGPLAVTRSGARLELDFPRIAFQPQPDALAKVAACFDRKPVEVYARVGSSGFLALYERAADVARLVPDFSRLMTLDRPVQVTARGEDGIDFVSRNFAPTRGIPEDPVTGSAQCVLAPFWSRMLGKTEFHARQVSRRGGDLWIRLEGDRVKIAGHTALFMKGTLSV